MSMISGGNYRQLVAASNVAASITGTLTETNLATVTIPALRANDQVVVVSAWSYTNSGNTKTLRIRYHTASGTSGTVVSNGTPTTTAAQRLNIEGGNQNATNSQSWALLTGGTAATGTTSATTTLDTTVPTFLNFTATLADTGETITLQSYRVEIVRV
jgi:hypothetical protein